MNIKVEDILAMQKKLDEANVPKQGREMHYIDDNGEYAVIVAPKRNECWTVTK